MHDAIVFVMTAKLPVFVRPCATCGAPIETNAGHIARGRRLHCSRACNAKANLLRKGATRHGQSGSPTYNSWAGMLQRCQNPAATKYPEYGARGVTVCDAWQSFQNFYDDMGARPPGTTIDRIDGSKGYEPGNCRWASRQQQQSNLRSNWSIDYGGRSYTLAELARELDVLAPTLKYRIEQDWPRERWSDKPRQRSS